MWQSEPNFTQDQLKRITTPTLIMAGEFDSIKSQHTEAMASTIPGASLSVIKGGSHFVLMEQPDIVNTAISQFLAK